ncbi:uncharacterized protein LOC6502792 isoform X1 [Drosophila ananassae]|uniref:uncharacterized protein LOC6502792 isoform X1 n=1 Tax=Drosophila ananassae TaxID=7217 RepID=UPI001CFFA427|nr:uncharacterized protein LOC6502792 isoform X1 [Drosophila ananassae]
MQIYHAIYIFIFLASPKDIFTHVSFTNLKCGSLDRRFTEFQRCYIKAFNRSHKYIDVHARLLQIPVKDVSINLKLMRYDHGYKPFFINVTFDACKFLKNQKHSIVKLFYNAFKDSSNLNHTCPYDHDLKLDHFWTGNIEADFTKYIPLINGDYSVDTLWYSNNIARSFVNIYLRLS